MITAPILTHPDFSQRFILDTDTSDHAIGAVLSQKVNDVERVVAYASRTLTKSERQYCVTRKEMLVVVYFIKYFRHYLYGREFLLQTDHGSLRWLTNFKNPEGQVARWLEVVSGFQMKIEHRPGRLHGNADGMSRLPCRQCGMSDMEKSVCSQSLPMDIAVRKISGFTDDTKGLGSLTFDQSEDLDLKKVISWLKGNHKPSFKEKASESYSLKSLWNQFEVLELHEGLLVRRRTDHGAEEGQYQVIVPFKQRRKVLTYAHDFRTAGHLGFKKTLTRVRQKYYWSGLRHDIKTYIAGCEKCSKRKVRVKPNNLLCSWYGVDTQWRDWQ